MKQYFATYASLLSRFYFILLNLKMDHFPPAPAIPGYDLRKAKKEDLDSITQIHIDGFLEEPMDNYCYPDRFKYMEEHFA
jgi:hypothetical protein